MIRLELPYHLRTLAKVSGEVQLNIQGAVTQRSVLDALNTPSDAARYDPRSCDAAASSVSALCVRRGTRRTNLLIRLASSASGKEPLLVIGAIAEDKEFPNRESRRRVVPLPTCQISEINGLHGICTTHRLMAN
jgi:hypothetical protein